MEDFEVKNASNFAHCFKILWTLSQKTWAFFGKFFSGFSQLLSARPEEYFAENQFFLQTKLCFVDEFWSCTEFFVPWQISYLGESKQQCTCLDENISKIYFDKMFFLNCLDLELRNFCFLGRSKGWFCKTLAYVSERENFQKKNTWTSDFSSILNVDPKELGIHWEEFGGDVRTKLELYRWTFYRVLFLKESVKNLRFFGWVMEFMR